METILFIALATIVVLVYFIWLLRKSLRAAIQQSETSNKECVRLLQDRQAMHTNLEMTFNSHKAKSIEVPGAFKDLLANGYQLAAVSVDCEWRLHNDKEPAIYFANAPSGKPGFYIRGMRWTKERFDKKFQDNAS